MNLPLGTFGRDGPPITRLGLGGEGILRTFGREAEAGAVIAEALAAGMTYLESARAYAGSEAYYGASLGSRRSDIFLASKAHDRSRRGALAMLETTLRSMRTDALDLWQLHDVRDYSEIDDWEHPEGAYAAFVEARERGLVRYIGLTGHHDPAVLRAALERFAFDAVLLPINPAEGSLDDAFERTVVPAARARGMAVIGMKVFARGLLFDPRAGGITPAEAVAYALSADIDAIVLGCDDTAQVAENAAAAAGFTPLDPAARAALETRVASVAGALAYYRAPASSVR
jgi:aryl-alcohol dehydrogenase-like predicted oxidoreductase